MEDRFAAERADPCVVECLLVAVDACGFALARDDLRHPPSLDAVGAVHVRHGLQQPLALLIGDAGQNRAIGGDRFEQVDGLAQARRELRLVVLSQS